MAYIVAARLTQPLQRSLYQASGWWALEPGLELTELGYQATGWARERRLIVVRQSVKRKTAPGKTLSLFADDPDIEGWRYGAFVTTLELPMVEVWRTYRGRADCENRIKDLEADFGLDAFNMRDFWATEAALGFAMLAYNLMSLFRQAVLRTRVQHTLSNPPWPGAGHRWRLAPRYPPEQADALRASPKTRLVRRSLGQRLRSPGHSGSAKWLMDNLGSILIGRAVASDN
jgi:hypothetical protein